MLSRRVRQRLSRPPPLSAAFSCPPTHSSFPPPVHSSRVHHHRFVATLPEQSTQWQDPHGFPDGAFWSIDPRYHVEQGSKEYVRPPTANQPSKPQSKRPLSPGEWERTVWGGRPAEELPEDGPIDVWDVGVDGMSFEKLWELFCDMIGPQEVYLERTRMADPSDLSQDTATEEGGGDTAKATATIYLPVMSQEVVSTARAVWPAEPAPDLSVKVKPSLVALCFPPILFLRYGGNGVIAVDLSAPSMRSDGQNVSLFNNLLQPHIKGLQLGDLTNVMAALGALAVPRVFKRADSMRDLETIKMEKLADAMLARCVSPFVERLLQAGSVNKQTGELESLVLGLSLSGMIRMYEGIVQSGYAVHFAARWRDVQAMICSQMRTHCDRLPLYRIAALFQSAATFARVDRPLVLAFTDYVCGIVDGLRPNVMTAFVLTVGSSRDALDEFWMFLMAKRVQDKGEAYSPAQLTPILKTYADAGLEDEEFYTRMASVVKGKFYEFTPVQLMRMISAMERVRYRDEDLLKASLQSLDKFFAHWLSTDRDVKNKPPRIRRLRSCLVANTPWQPVTALQDGMTEDDTDIDEPAAVKKSDPTEAVVMADTRGLIERARAENADFMTAGGEHSEEFYALPDQLSAVDLCNLVRAAGQLDYRVIDEPVHCWRAVALALRSTSLNVFRDSTLASSLIILQGEAAREILPAWLDLVLKQKTRDTRRERTAARRQVVLQQAVRYGLIEPLEPRVQQTLDEIAPQEEMDSIMGPSDRGAPLESSSMHLEVAACLSALDVFHEKEIPVTPYTMDIIIPSSHELETKVAYLPLRSLQPAGPTQPISIASLMDLVHSVPHSVRSQSLVGRAAAGADRAGGARVSVPRNGSLGAGVSPGASDFDRGNQSDFVQWSGYVEPHALGVTTTEG
ncbi:unnamed protein product [Vitrella brassicaformis CCMP3155]|uniref:Uncharacterized protein n=1 Tax=Vitrella brassicaformis (strain CCMP3155) TaxID=1169540 RepID=A0A0G4EUV3_VITBC|nr:unnamed protein product [Vitrella brassicaformis CCMP3155]|eukprot:CEM02234.1 unnamed protein product [Vitrella brassicaformis CCMP3155]